MGSSHYKDYYSNSTVKSKLDSIGDQIGSISQNIKKLKRDLSGVDNADYLEICEDLKYIEGVLTQIDMVRTGTHDVFIERAEYFDSVNDYYSVGFTFSDSEFNKYTLSNNWDDYIPMSPSDENELDATYCKLKSKVIDPSTGNNIVLQYIRIARYHYTGPEGNRVDETRESNIRERTVIF